MNRTLLRIAAIAALLFVGLSIDLRLQAPRTTTAIGREALPLGAPLNRRVPGLGLRNAAAGETSLPELRGRWVVLAPAMTLCNEVCPLTTGALLDLQSHLRAAGLVRRVTVVAVSVDPWRDTPRRLRAYRRLTGAGLRLWTGSVGRLRRFWRAFGVDFRRVPRARPAAIDWMTGRPERFDVEHGDGLFLLGPGGRERVAVTGPPELNGRLGTRLRRLLDARGKANLARAKGGWSVGGVIADLRRLTGTRGLPAPSSGGGGRLVTGEGSLAQRLEDLRGGPVVLNVWASWCPPCREELPLFAAAASRFGARVAFLGADLEDDAESARGLLASEHLPYSSYPASAAEVSAIAPARGTPVTIYLGSSGQLLGEHIGAYASQADLDRDVRRYLLEVEG